MSPARAVAWGLVLLGLTAGVRAQAAQLGAESTAPLETSSSPGDYRGRLTAGRALAAEGRFADAAALLEAAAALYPEDFPLRLELAFAWLRAERFVDAEREYREALALNEDAFDARLGLADALAGQGRWAEVRDATERLLAERDEARLHTRHALAHFWLGDWSRARAHSARALQLMPDDLDARLGLAWVAQRQGHVAEARAGFEAVRAATTAPRTRASAEEGLALLGPRHRAWGSLHGLAQQSPGLPLVVGAVGALDVLVDDRWLVAGRYRGLTTPLLPADAAATQHEGWLRLGWVVPQGEVVAHGALLAAGTGLGPLATVVERDWLVGLSARVRALVDWQAAALSTATPERTLWQADLGARAQVTRWLALSLGARGQAFDDTWRLGGTGLLQARGEAWALGVGGAYGSMLRPVELDVAAIYDVDEEQLGRGSVRAALRLAAHWWLQASYDLEVYRGAAADRLQHRGALGLGYSP